MQVPCSWPPELATEDIRRITPLDPGYEDHGSDVWLVEKEAEEYVLRSSRHREIPDNPFWQGCRRLFGLDPRRTSGLKQLHGYLQDCQPIAVPKILDRYDHDRREFIKVERMHGKPLSNFCQCSREGMIAFGEWLGCVHRHTFNVFGSLGNPKAFPLAAFHPTAAAVMEALVQRYYSDDPDLVQALPVMKTKMGQLAEPHHSTLIMVDMDPTQFLMSNGHITAVVDTEAYVLGPSALDFIALEYVLDSALADAVAIGYERCLRVPSLEELRDPYRYLYRVMDIQGDVPLEQWLAQPVLF